MPSIPIRNLVAGGGVNKDEQSNSLKPNAFDELINVRASAGRLERFGDTIEYQDEYSDYEHQDGDRALFDIVLQGNPGLVLVTSTDVYYDIGAGWINITPSYSTFVDATDWELTQYGDSFILTSLSNVPFVFVAGEVMMEEFNDWPANYKTGKIFAYKNFLIAVNISISNTEQSGLVLWSHTVLDGDVVNVAWDNLSTNLAGENILPDGSGVILDGGVLRDSAILYTERTVWRMDITNTVAGTTPLVFNFRRVFGDDGILRPRCFAEANGVHFVIGANRIYTHDGFNRQSLSDNRVNRFFYGRLGNQGFAFVTHYPRPQEVVFSFGIKNFTQASEALVYNYQYNFWTRWVFSEDTGIFRYLTVGPKFDQSAPSWSTITGTWADYKSTSWGQLFPNTREQVPYGLDTANNRILQLDSDDENDQTPFTLVIQRRDLDLDEMFGQGESIRHVRRIIPLVTGEGTFTVQVGGRNALGQAVQWGPARTFTIGTDYKVDVRQSWRYPALRITQTSAQGRMSFTGFDIDMRLVSRR